MHRVTRLLTGLVHAFAVGSTTFLATAFFLWLFDANQIALLCGMLAIGRHALLDPIDRRMAAARYTELKTKAHLEAPTVRMETTGGSVRRFAGVPSSPADGQDWQVQDRPWEGPPSPGENAGRVRTRKQRVL